MGTMEYNCNYVQELKPSKSFSHLALFYTKVDSITLKIPGKYEIYSVTDFYSREQEMSKKILVWSKPYEVNVLAGEPITVDPTYDVSPPVQQMQHGINSRDVICSIGTYLIWHPDHRTISCVKSDHVQKFVERGWTKSELIKSIVNEEKTVNPLGVTALVTYTPLDSCLGMSCPPYTFYLKINSKSAAYLHGYDICGIDLCVKNNTLSILLQDLFNFSLICRYISVESSLIETEP
jgi:hypothetical protein